MCNKAADVYSSEIQFFLDRYKTQGMYDKVVCKEFFMLKYFFDTYKTQEMCDKAAYAFLPTLKFVHDCFVTNNMLEKLDDVIFSNDDIAFVDADSDDVTFLVMIWVLLI